MGITGLEGSFDADAPVSITQAGTSGLVLARSMRLNIRVAKGIRPSRTIATHNGSIFIHPILYAKRLNVPGRPNERRKMEL